MIAARILLQQEPEVEAVLLAAMRIPDMDLCSHLIAMTV